VLGAEVVDALGTEDVGGEEVVDGGQEGILVSRAVDYPELRIIDDHWHLADVLTLVVSECLGGLVAVGDAVAAGVVGDAFALLAEHTQRVVPGGAMDDPAERVGAPLRAAAP
jgi:hypothetical protein